jgi:hypothetical protein
MDEKDKPTFSEYVFRSNGNVVNTHDGRYFAYEETEGNARIFKTFLFVYYLGIPALSAICVVLGLFVELWDNLLFDMLFIWTLFFSISAYALNRQLYQNSDFTEVCEDSGDYAEVKKWKFSGKRTAFSFFVTVLAAVFFLANSVCLFSVRSAAANKAEIVRVEMNETPLLNQETINPRILKGQITNATLKLTAEARFTPHYITWTLNGEKLKDSVYREFDLCWFWNRDYLVQRCTLYIPLGDIRDGSVLEMACGTLHRRWVFDLSAE